MTQKEPCAPFIHPGVFDGTVGRCIFRQLPLSVTAGARAHCRSPLHLNEHWGHVSERQRRARWHRSGYTGSSAPMHHYNLGSEGSRAKPKKRDQWWRVSSKHVYSLSIRAHTHAVYFCTVKYTFDTVYSGDTERHRGSDVLESQWQTVIRYRCRWRCARGSRSSSWSCRRVSSSPFPRSEREKVNDRRRDERVSALDTCIRFKWARVYVFRTGQSGSGDLGWGQKCVFKIL